MPKPLVIQEKRRILLQIIIAGTGANGSHFLRNILQNIRAKLDSFSHSSVPTLDVDITIVDKDKVERKNLGNQLFDKDDIDEYKCVALAERYGEHYNLDIKRVTEYIKSIDMLKALFPPIEDISNETQVIPILCGMVDNNKSRQLFDEFFNLPDVDNLIYLDLGVEGVSITNKATNQLTEDEKRSIRNSGFGGQCVVGVKNRGEVILPPVGSVYSNILEDAGSSFPDESCGEAVINNPQRVDTNRLAAEVAATYINNLLHTGSIYSHRIEFNAQYGGSRPVFIQDESINKLKEVRQKGSNR
ncbi:hypothetical protein J2S74_002943 [Evansella vedderi]|uniref:THIF-type NAD/FAD binding fold domain-containing protein n=1 Tax=Evansella vedderi TaxID=38282 RepID=A0ABT9ZWG1_9BACI|nr:ThiF family adenylyltransferase [Evansella vedderi]MDQ0255561.1 hypothetical protein [Evansella vedderi]